jgi:hypothetical protein
MMVRERRAWVVMAALMLPGCPGPGGGGASATDTSTSEPTSGDPSAGSTDTSAPTGTPTSTEAPTSTGDPTGETTTTTATTETTQGEDTDGPAAACSRLESGWAEALTLTPALFRDGADPSHEPVCAIVNPERGFHDFVDLRGLDDGTLADAAAEGRSVVYGRVLLAEFRDAPLDAAVLAEIAAGFDVVRAHGMKVVPRFHYADAIDEPDAELERILGHIEQLAPTLQEHADVILTLQAGFIGAWGEWHASQHGLDAPGPRKQILDALLAALPPERTVSVRRPSFKEEAYGGPLTAETAHDGSALARVGHVNDCFLASEDDEGTYQLPGEKDYAIADSRFVPVGGETCALNPPRTSCPSALAELELHHWTHLNADYHPGVLASWQDEGCYEEIACRLGYRLAALGVRWGASGAPSGFAVAFDLVNDGFAAPVNARRPELVLDGPARVVAPIEGVDVRALLPGETATLCVDASLADAPPGSYRIGLRLADPAPTLADDPRQAIRLANDEAEVEWAEGINWFAATVTIEP